MTGYHRIRRNPVTSDRPSHPVRETETDLGISILSNKGALAPLDLVVSPIWVFDIDRHVIWWANNAAVQFWRANSREDLLARDYSTDSETVRRRLRQNFDHAVPGKPTSDTWTLYPKGEPVSVPLSLTPVQIDSNRRDGILIEVTTFDQTNTETTDWRLVEATRYTPIMISYYSRCGRLISMNPAAVEAFGMDGVDPDSVIDNQHKFQNRFTDQASAKQMLLDAANGNEPSGEYQVTTSAGRKWHQIAIRLGRDPVTGVSCLVVIEEDISSLKQAVFDLEDLNQTLEEKVSDRTAALETAINRAEQANLAKSEFLARMSHDLRTPLNAILGFSEILSSPGTRCLAQQRFQEYGGDIHTAADNLLVLVNDLLDLSRIEAGRFPIFPKAMDVCDLFKDVGSLFQAMLEERELTIGLNFTRPITVVSDRRALSQIVTNLMTNAVKYNRIGGSVSVSIEQPQPCGPVVITIADTGQGIPHSELEDIFEPYIRGRAEIATNSEGSGLGLPICKQLADLLHTDIDIQSKVGIGTTVTLTIPQDLGDINPAT